MMKEDLNHVLLTLTERECGIIKMRYGLDDGEEKTLEEVGRAFNVRRRRRRCRRRPPRAVSRRAAPAHVHGQPWAARSGGRRHEARAACPGGIYTECWALPRPAV